MACDSPPHKIDGLRSQVSHAERTPTGRIDINRRDGERFGWARAVATRTVDGSEGKARGEGRAGQGTGDARTK